MALSQVLSLRLRAAAMACALLAGFAVILPSTSMARETRTLKLHFTHTGERGEFTYRRNGQYDRKELERINHILRDWRRNEPTRMDPALLDLVWEIHRRTGSNGYIHIISAYRSPATNEMLRSRSSGVAQQSQHTRGKAMDFFIPDVPVAKLRAVALTMHGGGVGYYPGSGSPFVHVDTGSVRHWPRMTRQQLASVFPNGETLHVPSDGKPLPGYEKALARQKSGGGVAVASLDQGRSSGERPNVASWLKKVFGGGADEAEDNGLAAQRPGASPQPTAVARATHAPGAAAPQATPEIPAAVPAPRPAGAVEVAAAAEAQEPPAPTPRALPAKTRSILLAARERAQAVQLASAAGPAAQEEAAAPPRARPAAPTVVAALGGQAGSPPTISTSVDAALAGLYAAAGGGNPESAAADELLTAAALERGAASAEGTSDLPGRSELAAALLEKAGAASRSHPTEPVNPGSAIAAATALGLFGKGDMAGPAAGSKIELAYAPPNEDRDSPVAAQSRGDGKPARTDLNAAAVEVAAGPKTDRVGGPFPAAAPFLAPRLDAPLLQRLMSQETTRTAAFVMLARPQPRRPDLFAVPTGGLATLAVAQIGQPRTDRFQLR